jgi:hypothetical protein
LPYCSQTLRIERQNRLVLEIIFIRPALLFGPRSSLGEKPNEDGFAGAVRPENGRVLALWNRERQPVEYQAVALSHACIRQLKNRRRHQGDI